MNKIEAAHRARQKAQKPTPLVFDGRGRGLVPGHGAPKPPPQIAPPLPDDIPERPALTLRQSDILDFIQMQIALDQRPPTIREIGARFGIRSPNGVMCHIRGLVKKGYIENTRGAGARNIRLVNPPKAKCPHCGAALP